jgi:cell division septation protein DedD
LSISRYIKLISLQKNKNGFKGLTLESRNFECLTSDGNAIFLVSNVEIFRKVLDKKLTNWIDYKEIAKEHGLTLDDEGVTIPLPPSSEAKKQETSPEPKVQANAKEQPKKSSKASAKATSKTATKATSKATPKASNKAAKASTTKKAASKK